MHVCPRSLRFRSARYSGDESRRSSAVGELRRSAQVFMLRFLLVDSVADAPAVLMGTKPLKTILMTRPRLASVIALKHWSGTTAATTNARRKPSTAGHNRSLRSIAAKARLTNQQ